MRTAVVNEDSVVEDGDPIALPAAPPLSTRNCIVAVGSPVQIYASGTDTIIWSLIGTSPQGSVTCPTDSSITFFYALGIWYVTSGGGTVSNTVTSYNTRTGAIVSQLSDVTSLFTAAGQIFEGTGAGTGSLTSLPPTPVTVGLVAGPPTTGTWVAGQVNIDTSGVQTVCLVGGTPGTWQTIGYATGDYKQASSTTAQPGWLYCDGAAYSRSTYAALFGQLAWTTTGTTTLSGATISVVPSGIVSQLQPGMLVSVVNADGGAGITITNAVSGAGVVTFTANNNLVVNQTVTFAGFSVASGLSALNNGVYTVIPTGLSTTAFAITNAAVAAGTPTATASTVYTIYSASGTSIVLTSGIGVLAHTAGVITIYSVGAGDGYSLFQVPDHRGLVSVGAGAVGTNSQPTVIAGQNTANAVAGEAAHILIEAELAAHDHSATTSSEVGSHDHSGTTGNENSPHTHTVPSAVSGGTYGIVTPASFGITTQTNTTSGESPDHTHGFTTGNESGPHTHSVYTDGNSTAHNNIQPMLGVAIFIKT